MTTLTSEQRQLLEQPIYAWVTLHRPDGSLHSTVVWVDVDGDEIVFNTAVGRAKERYLRADPRLAISAVSPENPWLFISVSGEARFQSEGADAMIDRLAKKYLGAETYPFRRADEERINVRITPDQVIWNVPG